MSLAVPESSLTSEELARLSLFTRELAEALDEALADAGVSTVPYVDLSLPPWNVVAGSSATAVAQANTAAINLAITTYGASGASLVLPSGDIYIEQAAGGVAWSILFGSGITGIDLSGQGPNETRLIQNGVGDGGDWHAILFDRCTNCGIHDLHLEQGVIQVPDQIQLNHLLNITNSSLDGTGTTRDIYGYNLSFGKALGDQIRLFGDTAPIQNIRLANLTLRGNGICLRAWTPSTVYPLGSWVVNDSGKNYKCTTAGTSASSGGPTGTGTGITDGTAVWDYKAPREGARTCISVQRGYRHVEIGHFYATGAQNGVLDIEPTSAGGGFAGLEVMEYLNIHDGTLDNSLGDTAVAATFSGITAGTKSYGNRMSNVNIIAGCLSMIQTDTQTLDNITIVVKTALPNEPNFSNVLVRQSNVDLTMRGIKLIRSGTAGTGNLLDIELADRFTLDGFSFQQGVVGYPVIMEAVVRPNIRNGRIHWTAGTPSARSALYLAAINATVDGASFDNVSISTSSTKMLAAVELISRTTNKITNVSVTNIRAAGYVSTGVFMSIQGTPGDVNPIIQGCSFGTDPTWVAESEIASTPIDTIFPIVAGSKGANTARHLEGNVAPGGACVGNLGDIYTYRPTTTTAALYVKESQSVAGTPDNGGWTLK